MRGTLILLPVGLTLVALMASAASAQSCIDTVRALGEWHGIATDPPTLSADRNAPGSEAGVSTRELGRSGGVIEPPLVHDKAVIAPPPGTDAAMPTLPKITPSPPSPAGGSETPKEQAVDRMTLQALLVAARAEAERGNEQGCLEGLAKVKRLDQHG